MGDVFVGNSLNVLFCFVYFCRKWMNCHQVLTLLQCFSDPSFTDYIPKPPLELSIKSKELLHEIARWSSQNCVVLQISRVPGKWHSGRLPLGSSSTSSLVTAGHYTSVSLAPFQLRWFLFQQESIWATWRWAGKAALTFWPWENICFGSCSGVRKA